MKFNRTRWRLGFISFLVGVNLVLGRYFLLHNSFHLPTEFLSILTKLHLVSSEHLGVLQQKVSFVALSDDDNKTPSLNPQVIFIKLNQERKLVGVSELEYSSQLASVADILLTKAEKYDFEVKDELFSQQLKEAIETVGYNYEHVSHNMLVGPATEQAVVDAWYSSDDQVKAIQDDDFTEVGFATKIVELKDLGTVGVVVQVLGKPRTKRVVSRTPLPLNYPNISDLEVFNALNEYRRDHKVQKLTVDQHLCDYAEKRVNDLISYGGLDEHAGFKADFQDQNNLPASIQAYSGHSIAENLAHQYCKNMTTGDSFIAQTGTAIIEWCFDSSTKGHREAQLNPDFSHVCVRHGDHMFVVIFGD